MQIIYEDNHIIAVNKACGELVQSDITNERTLVDEMKDYLKNKYNKPGNVFIGLPHRLDRPTSGIVLLAKTGKALERLNKMFSKRGQIKKTYWAVVNKRPPKYSDTMEHYLKKNKEKNKSFAYPKPVPGAKYARLTYRHAASLNKYYLLEIDLFTGRHHQIRVQLGTLNLRIKGDVKYGFPRANEDKGIHLHARKLEFIHPVKKNNITIIADPPDDIIWNEFMKLFRANKFSPVNPV
ncbi:MAG: RluA family pseudouridine synthase [Prolixibacteraceae bacterium]|nr:RluA family pseudouridine synthase [Prolixibacteraceae bacterium]MDD4754587.1 RluA family pseudouridine synthase [Prolixibacteraceae bacterium]NLO01944.1 RluA family pseudouridine synthase [Bacteroidales bacterium]